MLQDLRFAFRDFARNAGFTGLVIATLALGIGANTAIFSVIYAVLLRPPDFPHADRLIILTESVSQQKAPVSWVNYQQWLRWNHTFEDIAAFETASLTLTGRGDASLVRTAFVSAGYFRLTGWRPVRGRLFTAADDHLGAPSVALVSAEFWARIRGSHALGTTITIDRRAYEVIGILPPGLQVTFQHPEV